MANIELKALIDGLTEETAPDLAADFLLLKDTSGADLNKMLLWRAGQGAHGSDIASASTVNLDTATGDLVDVTGTTTITAITLSNGLERTVRFTGILTLTHGSSLVLPTAANITTAAGDFAIFRGYASSVVRCVSYSRANGTSLVSGGMAIGATITGSPTTGSVLFVGAAGVLAQDNANFFWDDSANRLLLGATGLMIGPASGAHGNRIFGDGSTYLGVGIPGGTSGLFYFFSDDGTAKVRVLATGSISVSLNSAVPDATVAAGECFWWFDSTNGAAKAMFKGKSANGTVVSGSVTLS